MARKGLLDSALITLAAGVFYLSLRRINLGLPPARYRVKAERALPLPMGDGQTLLADHYFPVSAGKFPTILIRSPWGRGWENPPFSLLYLFISEQLAGRGYHAVVASMRSDPHDNLTPSHEGEDGRATLDWIARRDWFDGNLGMWGASILGYAQWATANDAPPFLKAIVPTTTTADWSAFFYEQDTLSLDRVFQLLFLLGSMDLPLSRMMQEMKSQDSKLAAAALHLPLATADEALLGRRDESYRAALSHPDKDDEYWQPLRQDNSLASINAASHLVSGWYDIFLDRTLADYAALRAVGRSPYLTIGPWAHLSQEVGWESLCQGYSWYEAHLKGDNAGLRAAPVRVYLMGADEWCEFGAFPPPSKPTPVYLRSNRTLAAAQPGADEVPDHYTYNPGDPTPSVGGALMSAKAGPVDNRELEARPDVLCYTSEPLREGLEIIGPVHLTLFVGSSVEHTDFIGRLCDVHPDGRSINICDGMLRVAPGKGPALPDGTRRIEIQLSSTAYRFVLGHRIRLQVASAAHPRWNRNLNTGERFDTATRLVVAEQAVYHDPAHPSALVLPVV